MDKNNFDVRKRTFDFAVSIIKLRRHLEKGKIVVKVLMQQLLRAGTSIGANLEEGQAGQSAADFISKNAISLKEARETN
ncbi:MAG: four helix bundle protein [Pyrinomonadaceae bacterium]